jgi:hemoglobin
VIKVHQQLNKKIPLKRGHFRRWLYLFHTTVDELYEGEYAYRAKERASTIAESIQKRLSII